MRGWIRINLDTNVTKHLTLIFLPHSPLPLSLSNSLSLSLSLSPPLYVVLNVLLELPVNYLDGILVSKITMLFRFSKIPKVLSAQTGEYCLMEIAVRKK